MKIQAVLLIVFVASAYQAFVFAVDVPAAKDISTTATDLPPNNITTVAPPTNITTSSPPNNTTIAPTTLAPNSSTTSTTPTPSTTSTTPVPSTTIAPNTTTVSPITSTTEKPTPTPCRRFDGLSFIGGIVLTVGLIAIGFVSHKIYKSKFERNYHTL